MVLSKSIHTHLRSLGAALQLMGGEPSLAVRMETETLRPCIPGPDFRSHFRCKRRSGHISRKTGSRCVSAKRGSVVRAQNFSLVHWGETGFASYSVACKSGFTPMHTRKILSTDYRSRFFSDTVRSPRFARHDVINLCSENGCGNATHISPHGRTWLSTHQLQGRSKGSQV